MEAHASFAVSRSLSFWIFQVEVFGTNPESSSMDST
jgi:hypothetical protein